MEPASTLQSGATSFSVQLPQHFLYPGPVSFLTMYPKAGRQVCTSLYSLGLHAQYGIQESRKYTLITNAHISQILLTMLNPISKLTLGELQSGEESFPLPHGSDHYRTLINVHTAWKCGLPCCSHESHSWLRIPHLPSLPLLSILSTFISGERTLLSFSKAWCTKRSYNPLSSLLRTL